MVIRWLIWAATRHRHAQSVRLETIGRLAPPAFTIRRMRNATACHPESHGLETVLLIKAVAGCIADEWNEIDAMDALHR